MSFMGAYLSRCVHTGKHVYTYILSLINPTPPHYTYTGSDIMLEMYQSGELLEAIEIAAAS